MANMSARFSPDIADLKQIIFDMSTNKRGRKQSKKLEGSSTSSAENRANKSMETYDAISHDVATSWTNMCESEGEDDTSDQNNVSQGYSTPSQGKAGLSHASRVGIHRHLHVHKER
jgi:hypothetical protein